MKKQIAAGLFRWLIWELLLLVIVFWSGSRLAMAVAAVFLVLPPITFLSNLWMRRSVETSMELPLGATKKEALQGTVTAVNRGLLPLWKVGCQIDGENRLTGERLTRYLLLRCPAKGSASVKFVIESEHCGFLNLTLSRVWLLDWFGFLPAWVRQDTRAQASILPDTFGLHLELRLSMTQKQDAEHWSQVRKGEDPTELFALRDYAAGDSLRRIHWKMTAKRGQLIVREASLPIEKSLLLYWNKNLGNPEAGRMDAMAECVSSVAQEILNQGTTFVLGWTEGRSRILEPIDTEEQLFQAIPHMLKYGGEPRTAETEAWDANEYSKVLYFAGDLPEQESLSPGEEIQFLLCGESKAEEDGVVRYRWNQYREDLEYLEI